MGTYNRMSWLCFIALIISVIFKIGCAPIPSNSPSNLNSAQESRINIELLYESYYLDYEIATIDGVEYLVVSRSGGGVTVIKHEPKDQHELQEAQEEMD